MKEGVRDWVLREKLSYWGEGGGITGEILCCSRGDCVTGERLFYQGRCVTAGIKFCKRGDTVTIAGVGRKRLCNRGT